VEKTDMAAPARSAESATPVLIARKNGVATITLNRPERLNAIDGALGHALVEALHRAAQDAEIRAVVLTGAGRGFCSGGDLGLLREAREHQAVEKLEGLLRSGKQIVLAIASMPKPVIAAVNGPAAGAGCNLALACEICIASDSATFTQSFAKLGLFPDFGATYFLPRLVGVARAAELLYTAETLDATEALRLGLVSRVVPQDRLAEEAAAIAGRLAAAPPLVLRGIKQALFTDNRKALEQALEEEIRWQIRCFESKDSREGLLAYFEKRAPRFRGE
jgi:2-(1,2-epoxy-1,2-dihydrophenyl)acetyl-CoA isomerase